MKNQKDEYFVYQSNELGEYNGVIYKQKTKHTLRATLCIIAFVLCFAIIAIFTSAENVYIKTFVRGPSMMPTLNESFDSYAPNKKLDIVYLNSYAQVKKGDIIVDHNKISAEIQYVIKRLIAIEGDTLQIIVPDDENAPTKVYVNDVLLNESYINEKHFNGLSFLTNSAEENARLFKDLNPQGNSKNGKITIPKGYAFYMGDNRNNSSDCRASGPRKMSGIVGKVDYIIKYGVDKDLTQADLFWPGVRAVFDKIGNSIVSIFKY